MRQHCAHCDPSYLEDPAAVFEQLRQRQLLIPGPDLLVVVNNGTANIVGAAELLADLEEDFGGTEVAAAAERAGAGPRDAAPGPRHKTVYLIRRRTGRTTPLPRDMRGWTSWLNASNWLDCYVGDWFLITDNGWRALLSEHGPAGLHPRLRTLRAVGD